MLRRLVFLFTVMTAAAGCSGESRRADDAQGLRAPLPMPLAPGAWNVTQHRSQAVRFTARSLREVERDRTRAALAQTRVERVDLPGDVAGQFGNPKLYRLTGAAEYEREVFIVPRFFVRSAVFGGRVASHEDAGGRTTLRFPVALVDGLQNVVSSGLSSIPVPSALVIADPAGLQGALAAELGFRPTLRAFPACPEGLRLTFGGESLQAKALLPRGLCPVNQLFDVTVSGTPEQIRRLVEHDLVSGEVRLSGQLRLEPSFIDGMKSLELSTLALRSRLYQKFVELPFGLGAGAYLLYPAADVRIVTTELVNELLADAGAPALVPTETAPLVDDILAIHFDPEPCAGSDGPCFRYRAQPLLDEPAHYLDTFALERVPLAGPEIALRSRLQGLSSDESQFVIAGEDTDDSVPPSPGRRGGLLRQMREGDLIELELSELTARRREYPAPVFDAALSRLDNAVCVKWGEPPVREETDYDNCVAWNEECARSRTVCVREKDVCREGSRECVKRGVGLCFFCCDHVDFVCRRWGRECAETTTRCEEYRRTSCKTFGTKWVPAGPAPCLETENQWTKFWRLSENPSIVTKSEELSKFDRQSLFDGIRLQFTGYEPDSMGRFRLATTTCPLSAFRPEVSAEDGGSLKLRLRLLNNRDVQCEPFNRWNRKRGYEPELTVQNRLTAPERYSCGTLEENWSGRRTYSCPRLGLTSEQPVLDTYYPRYSIQGVLRLPGVRFQSTQGE